MTIFDAARANLHPCLGCGACGMDGECVQKDDMARLRQAHELGASLTM